MRTRTAHIVTAALCAPCAPPSCSPTATPSGYSATRATSTKSAIIVAVTSAPRWDEQAFREEGDEIIFLPTEQRFKRNRGGTYRSENVHWWGVRAGTLLGGPDLPPATCIFYPFHSQLERLVASRLHAFRVRVGSRSSAVAWPTREQSACHTFGMASETETIALCHLAEFISGELNRRLRRPAKRPGRIMAPVVIGALKCAHQSLHPSGGAVKVLSGSDDLDLDECDPYDGQRR